MKVSCPKCKAGFSVNDAKIPDNGCNARCPKCRERFFIKKSPSPEAEHAQTDKINCPKCECLQPQSDTCINCGIIFSKFNKSMDEDIPSVPQSKTPLGDALKKTATVTPKFHKPSPVVPIVLVVFICVIGLFIYVKFIEPFIVDDNFDNMMSEYGPPELEFPTDENSVSDGDIPYRIGKVIIVTPEHTLYINPRRPTIEPPQIHRTWYSIGRSMRASKPEQVNTLIRISKHLRQTQRYQKIGGISQKVVSTHIVHIDVYNWRNQTFIGRWTLDPGTDIRETMTEDELNEMIKVTSNTSILKFLKSMPDQQK